MILSLLFTSAGVAAVYIALGAEFPRGVALTTIALLFGATSLLLYAVFDPSARETALFAIAAWCSLYARPSAVRAPRAARIVAWVGLGALPWTALWFTGSNGAPLEVFTTRAIDVLFSARHGFLSFTPVAYVAVIGTIAYVRHDRVWAATALAAVLLTAILLGARVDWADRAAFAGRSMTWLLALLAPGLAHLLDLLRRRPAVALAPVLAAPLVWNYLLMVQYTIGLLPKDEPVSFARLVRQQADAYARGSHVYAFAFPANVLFAWRERVPIARYDVLALEPRRASVDLTMDRAASRFLLDGWDAPGTDGAAPVWWIGGRHATIVLPLSMPHDRAVQITVKARTRFEEPAVQADLVLQLNGHDVGQFSPAATAPTEARMTVSPEAGRIIWRDGYNRLTFVSRGVHRVDPADMRPPGPLARRVGAGAWPVAIYRVAIAPQ